MDDSTVKPHAASLAVWAAPNAAIAGELFTLKAGAKCSDGCDLSGQRIEVCDAAGAVVASGQTGATPWPGTAALYWTELTLPAPVDVGPAAWSARLDANALDVPHDCAAASFSVTVIRPPEHTLTVKVVAKDTAAPIEDADIRLGACRARTGPSGVAQVRIGKGRYELHVWKAGYETPATAVEVRADAFVEIEALALPDDDPDARWTG
jgi:hypothetical protein